MFFPHYMELDFITRVQKRGVGADAIYVPNLPDIPYGMVLNFCNGINYYAYPMPANTNGLMCFSHVVYHAKDDAIMKARLNIGAGNDVTKVQEYKDLIGKTVREHEIEEEQNRLIREAESRGETVDQATLDAVTYEEEDADDGVPVFVFLRKDYVDA